MTDSLLQAVELIFALLAIPAFVAVVGAVVAYHDTPYHRGVRRSFKHYFLRKKWEDI